MHVLISPAAFRESFTAGQVSAAIAEGVRAARPGATLTVLPVSDGGSDLLAVLHRAVGGRIESRDVNGPLWDTVRASTLWLDPETVVIEAAQACGLHLVAPADRDPCHAHTRGVGELMRWAAGSGASQLFVGLGGSGTVDGGMGMARSLGYEFLGAGGTRLADGGCALTRLERILPPSSPVLVASSASGASSSPARSRAVRVVAVADVLGPLLGPDGAARRFGPQKGASPEQVELLEAGLSRLAERVRGDLGGRVEDLPGAGAAGGLGAGLVAFAGARIVRGAAWVSERLGLPAEIGRADLVITGEGCWDAGSPLGKAPHEVLLEAGRLGRERLLMCGRVVGAAPPGVHTVHGEGKRLSLDDIRMLVVKALA